ncbi:MAG: multicopper polyphenol oxidase [Rhodanobacteraceae bacterium]|jgi:YfiH family protein|nr:MAG: multicopper polyphenol oxidase [Rhodanobacteraceae bacterium]
MADAPAAWIVPEWPAPVNVRVVVTTRDGSTDAESSPYGFNIGTRCGDDPETVARNRAFLRKALSLPSEPQWLRQVHGTDVVPFDSSLPRAQSARLHPPQAGEGWGGGADTEDSQADAAVTRTPGVVLAIQTADCLPVLFCNDDGSEIAAAHAGWRGLSAGVLENTLDAMRTPRENIMVWLGPAIAAQSYEVGDEVRDAFLAHDPAASAAFTPTRPGHWLCDLYALARQRLHAAGVTRVSGGGLDTFTDTRLHSYRRDGARSGRMASLVWTMP